MTKEDNRALKEYFQESKTFDQDRLLAADRSKRVAWSVAGAAGLIAAVSVFAVAALAPLKSVEALVIRVDQSTGVPEVMTALSDGQEEYQESVSKYFLALYVRTREGYSYATREAIYNQVQLLSDQQVQKEFSAYYNASNEQSPQYIYGKNQRAEVEIRSVTFLGKDLAQVRYYRVVKTDDGEERRSHWVSTLAFRYDAKSEITMQDRLINPLGFIVTEYRSDDEVVR